MKSPKRPADVYELVPEPPAKQPAKAGAPEGTRQAAGTSIGPAAAQTLWRRVVRAATGESSLIERESIALVALSAADLLVTHALLRRGPAYYESNPVAHWFFLRWNIAGIAFFKFAVMGFVIVIGELVERHRTGWGRGLLLVSCLLTLLVVLYGLRLLVS